MKRIPTSALIVGVALLFVVLVPLPILIDIFTHRDFDCVDFQTQAEATEMLMKFPEDVYNLDGDLDGKPCEDLPA